MRPLTIVVTTADAERMRGALTLAAAQAALGGGATLFLQQDAVALLREPIGAPGDARHRDAGLPTLVRLMEDAMALGVAIVACQSGMDLAGLRGTDLPPGVSGGGPVSLLQALPDDARLTFA